MGISRITGLNYSCLERLLTTVDRGSFAAASEALSLTLSAVSKSVGKTEKELGIPLIERDGRSIKPTKAGLLVCSKGTELLSIAEDIMRIAEQFLEEKGNAEE
ncbi:MAG: LysR family transcriptional regulator [Coriobacteriia bacterium]|nr:LysR family transcriptional regulator [Coriobacteriia bacterium]